MLREKWRHDSVPSTHSTSIISMVRTRDIQFKISYTLSALAERQARFPLGEFVRTDRKKVLTVPTVRGEFFRQPVLTKHVAELLFSLRVARIKSPSGK